MATINANLSFVLEAMGSGGSHSKKLSGDITPALNGLLNDEQRELLRMALMGMSDRSIAARVHRARQTVHDELQVAFRLVAVQDRRELMAKLLRASVLDA